MVTEDGDDTEEVVMAMFRVPSIFRQEALDEPDMGSLLEWPEWFPARRGWWPALDSDFLRVEESTEDSTLVIRVDAPGIDPEEDVDIRVRDGVLDIRVERREKSESESENRKVHRSEVRYGSFRRSLRLPGLASESDIAASYDDGVLEIRVPLGEEGAGQKIEVRRGNS